MKLLEGLKAVSKLGHGMKSDHTTLLGLKQSIREFTKLIRQYPDFEHGRIQIETERMIRNHIQLMKEELQNGNK